MKKYYIALKKENNQIFLGTTRTSIADFLGISYVSVLRQLKKSNPYSNKKYTIWEDVTLMKIKNRGNNFKSNLIQYRGN